MEFWHKLKLVFSNGRTRRERPFTIWKQLCANNSQFISCATKLTKHLPHRKRTEREREWQQQSQSQFVTKSEGGLKWTLFTLSFWRNVIFGQWSFNIQRVCGNVTSLKQIARFLRTVITHYSTVVKRKSVAVVLRENIILIFR